MLNITPDYYKAFKCKASACSDNCCIGWKIDIDNKTNVLYSRTKGEFGAYLNNCIDRSGDVPFFKLDKNERCSLLDENNLCRIITNMGEDFLCQICTMHPRFCNYFGDVKEIGLGLCCEEAARLIIERNDFITYEISETDEENDDECDMALFENTVNIFNELANYLRYCNPDFECFQAVLDEIAYSAEALQYYYSKRDYSECRNILYNPVGSDAFKNHPFPNFIEFLKTLEIMDSKWTDKLNRLANYFDLLIHEEAAFDNIYPENNIIYANMAVYFLFRYFLNAVYDDDIYSPIFFTSFAVKTIKFCDILTYVENGKSITTWQRIENAKLFSKEIEYSTDNMDTIYDWLK